ASIILYEAESFEPQAILMTGRLYGREFIVEGKVKNIAFKIPGYSFDGKKNDKLNTPNSDKIFDIKGIPHETSLAWDGKAIQKAVKPILVGTSFDIVARSDFNPANTYVCNNVSYVVGVAIQKRNKIKLPLAGGQIEFESGVLKPKIQYGFLHMPIEGEGDVPEPERIHLFSEVFKKILSVMLRED